MRRLLRAATEFALHTRTFPAVAAAGGAAGWPSGLRMSSTRGRLPNAASAGLGSERAPARTRQLIITASGPDRPGIVGSLTRRVLEMGGSLEESRMARLGGDFSVLMLITMPDSTAATAERVTAKLLEVDGMTINTRWTESVSHEPAPGQLTRLSLRGPDMPGIAYTVSEYLANLSINIEQLDSSSVEMEPGGRPMFVLDALIRLPPDVETATVLEDLQRIQGALGVSIKLTPPRSS